ncbi:M1 family metallopeptidase [Maribacter sp. ANRC-HE7]|uniref:Aminopeptidase N n=1 Tax=Maribacter aquimaris TaxID=2737171 RepID=A0ABR7UXX7_9FLAO|nr:M1 family metallopeptidase [Maribacter aquimaris]MBD0776480.1 M1 family metallopeptidase [Maribacter aquimaris]
MVQRIVLTVIFGLVFTNTCAQHQDKVDFVHAKVNIHPIVLEKAIEGTVNYKFKILENVDSVFLDAKKMAFKTVLLNHKKATFKISDTSIAIYRKFKKNRSYALTLEYTAHPKQTVYFLGIHDTIIGNEQIWTQGQGKYTSHWLPSFDDMEEKVEFDLNISFDPEYEVIANGVLTKVRENEGLKTWSYDMRDPMSSYLLAFAIGTYSKQQLTSSSGISIENYYYPKDSLKLEPTYRYTRSIFDFMEQEIGVPYPWQNYKQIPVKDFLYAGMENTGTTIFSDGYVIDSIAFVDKNFVNVNAHELAHQWFGNLVTEKNGSHHWLHEGFATYYAYLAEKEIFGDDYFYWKLYDSAQQLKEQSSEGKGEALTNPKASSLTFYEKGAWALVMLRNELGDDAFKKGIKNYLGKYGFKNATIDDFVSEMESASTTDLKSFEKVWLRSPDFPYEKVKEYLVSNANGISKFLALKWKLTTSLEHKSNIIKEYWNASNEEELKMRMVLKYHKSFTPEMLKNAFNSESIKIRQALALVYSQKIPLSLKKDYESLLEDESYITQENALYRLWISFPQDRRQYLEKTKGVIGLPNKNVRLLWLLLASLTKDYDDDSKEVYLSELYGYTSPQFSMETRQAAFGIIGDVLEYTDQNILDLIDASIHHSWQFRKYARQLLDTLLKDDRQRNRIIGLAKGMNDNELRYIRTKLSLQ